LIIIQQAIKEFWRKADRRGRIFYGGQCNVSVWHRPIGSIAVGCHAVIEDWMHTPQQRLSMLFNGPDNSLESPLPGISTPSNNGFLGSWAYPSHPPNGPNGISIGSAVFCRGHPCDVINTQQSREWVTQSDPWPKWPIELLTHDPWVTVTGPVTPY